MYSRIAQHHTTYNMFFILLSCALVELIDRHQQRKWIRRSGATVAWRGVAWRGSAAVQQCSSGGVVE